MTEQADLALRPQRYMLGDRQLNPRLVLAFRLLLEVHHTGRENAATWERLREELAARGLEVTCVVAVGGDSEAGVYVVGDDSERRLIAAERVKRIRAEVEELEAFDRAMYERIAGALPLAEDQAA